MLLGFMYIQDPYTMQMQTKNTNLSEMSGLKVTP